MDNINVKDMEAGFGVDVCVAAVMGISRMQDASYQWRVYIDRVN